MKTRSALTVSSVLTAMTALALDFSWNPSAGNNTAWNTLSAWRVDDAVPARMPNEAADSVYISYTGNSLSRMSYRLWFPDSQFYAANPVHELEFGTLSSESGLHPLLTMDTNPDKYSGFSQTITVSNPDGFGGFWTSDEGRGKLVLKATALHSPYVKYFDSWGYMGVEVPESGTTATIGSLVRSGALRKSGAGKLSVENAGGADSRIYVDQGTLSLKGVSSSSLEPALPSGSVLHLDADSDDSFVTAEENYGGSFKRVCVNRWNDADGGANYGYVPASPRSGSGYICTARAPYFSSITSTTGRRLVDFGLPATCASELVPSNCCLQLASTVSAREVFYVAENTVPADDSAAGSGSLLGGVWDYNLQGGGRAAVFGFYANDVAMRADITINGCPGSNRQVFPTRFNGADMSSLSVVGIRLSSALAFNAIATDRNNVNGTGGWRVGEIVAYDRELSDDERAEAVRYLMRKWHRDYDDKDVGEIVVHSDSAAIEVPAGRTVRVGNLSSQGGRIVKEGAGTLLVGGVAQTNVVIEVRGGKIEFAGTTTATSAPAADPMLWLDASVTASFVCEGGDTDKITRWNDRRGGAYTTGYAEIPGVDAGTVYHTSAKTSGHYPKLVAGQTPTGLDAVSFGPSSTASWMWLQPRDQTDSYAAFVVYRVNTNAMDHNYGLGSSNDDLLKGSGQLISPTYSTAHGRNARWALNGRAVDPWFSDFNGTYNSLEWRVQSYSGTLDKIRGDLLGKYSTNQDAYQGNVDIAEVLLYDRPLTLDEVRTTEAYLMKRWLDRKHPEVESEIGSYEFPAGAAVTLENEVEGTTDTVASVSGGNGSLVKSGAGAVVVGEIGTGVATGDVSVSGSLDITCREEPYDTGAAFHFDAADAASFQFDIVDNGNGTATTNVLQWTDGIDANLVAKSDYWVHPPRSEGKIFAHPVYKAATMPDGRTVPVVDFGSRNDTGSAAALTFYKGSQFGVNNLSEVFVVFADKRTNGVGGDDQDYIDAIGSDYDTHFIRNGGCGLLSKWAADFDSNKNMVYVDGEQKANTFVLPAGFHIVSYRPSAAGNVVGSFGRDRNTAAGGGMIAEALGFTGAITEQQRERILAALHDKWIQYVEPRVEIGSITLADGAVFTVNGGSKLETDALTLGAESELNCAGLLLADDSTITVGVSAEGVVGSVAVAGPVEFAGGVTVAFSSANSGDLKSGSYPIISGTSVAGFDSAEWTVTDANILGRRSISFQLVNNGVVMKVAARGLSIIVK